jgi:UDP-glucose 4-epimerase
MGSSKRKPPSKVPSPPSITTIFHFAAKKSAPESIFDPLGYYENNLIGSFNLLKVMEKHTSCKEFLFSSSAAVYGEQDDCT